MDKETLKEAARVCLFGWANKDEWRELMQTVYESMLAAARAVARALTLLIVRPAMLVLAPLSIPLMYWAIRKADLQEKEARARAREALIKRIRKGELQ